MALSPLHLLQFIVIQLHEGDRPVSEVTPGSLELQGDVLGLLLGFSVSSFCLVMLFDMLSQTDSLFFLLFYFLFISEKNLSARAMIQDHCVALSATKYYPL